MLVTFAWFMSTVPQSSQDSLPVRQHVYSVVAMLTLCKQCMFRHKTDRVTHRSVCDVSHPLRDQLGWRWHSRVTNLNDSSVAQIHVWYPPSHPDATHLCDNHAKDGDIDHGRNQKWTQFSYVCSACTWIMCSSELHTHTQQQCSLVH